MPLLQITNVTDAGGIAGAFAALGHFLLAGIAFLVILIAGYFVAAYLGAIVGRLLRQVGFDAAVERGGIKKMLETSGVHPSALLGKIVFYTVFLFVLELAFGIFGPNPISDLLTRVIAFLPNVFVAIVTVVVASSIAAGVRDLVRSALGGLSYGRLLASLASVSIIVIGVFMALNQLEIAPAIVNGLFYAMLAIVVGVSVVAIGGAGIVPMRSRWEGALNALEAELPKAKVQIGGSTAPSVPSATGETPLV